MSHRADPWRPGVLGGGVSAVVKTPSFGHTPANLLKSHCWGKLTPPLFFLFFNVPPCFLFTIEFVQGHRRAGRWFSFFFFYQTKEKRSVGLLHLERFTERGFQRAFLPLSFAVGEDSGSATVRWCGCRPTQLNKHTYVMLINVSCSNDTHAPLNLPEKSGGESMCLSFLRWKWLSGQGCWHRWQAWFREQANVAPALTI